MNTIPSHDLVLRRVVDRVTEREHPDSAADLAASLRPLYPRIAVFERQLSGEHAQFYVYRAGRYEPERRDEWWAMPGVPRITISAATGELKSVSGAWAELMRANAADLKGRDFVDFVQPEARVAAAAMFEAISQYHEVRSEALLQRPDGSTLAVEFRAARKGDEIEASYRPLE